MQRLILGIAFFWSVFLNAQHDSTYYVMDDDFVIFQFHLNVLDSLLKEEGSLLADLDSMDFELLKRNLFKVQHEDGWYLLRKSENVFLLKKHLDDFTDYYEWKSKYLVEGPYWKRPISQRMEDGEKVPKIPGFRLDTASNITFTFDKKLKAERVFLAGSFNLWNPGEILMKKENDRWTSTLYLPPGIYEYKFIVDGDWVYDTDNPLKVLNEHDTYNSILLVGESVTFELKDYKSARRVYLSGSFNNWDERNLEMVRTDKGWKLTLPLPPGKHYYKFIVDGMWMTDPVNPLEEHDLVGHKNSVLLIN